MEGSLYTLISYSRDFKRKVSSSPYYSLQEVRSLAAILSKKDIFTQLTVWAVIRLECQFTLSAKILSAKSPSAKILSAKSPIAKILSAKTLGAKILSAEILGAKILGAEILFNPKLYIAKNAEGIDLDLYVQELKRQKESLQETIDFEKAQELNTLQFFQEKFKKTHYQQNLCKFSYVY